MEFLECTSLGNICSDALEEDVDLEGQHVKHDGQEGDGR
jgi:hypothetical protein